MASVLRPRVNVAMASPSPENPNIIGCIEEVDHESVANSLAPNEERQPLMELPSVRNASPQQMRMGGIQQRVKQRRNNQAFTVTQAV